MNKKAQISIELIILLAIFLLFFQAMILPAINFSENVLKDTQAIVVSKKNIENLSLNIEQLANQDGYGKREVYFYIPTNTVLDCNNLDNTINYVITISKQAPIPSGCDENGVCEYTRQVYLNKVLDCDKIGPGYKGILVIEKTELGNISISEN